MFHYHEYKVLWNNSIRTWWEEEYCTFVEGKIPPMTRVKSWQKKDKIYTLICPYGGKKLHNEGWIAIEKLSTL